MPAHRTRCCWCSMPIRVRTHSSRHGNFTRRSASGLVLTKLDGTAKGGIVIAIANELGIPIRYIGVGESAEDFGEFDAGAFAEALIEGPEGRATTGGGAGAA